MTLKEAIESNLPFKREAFAMYLPPIREWSDWAENIFSVEDVQAMDWMVEERKPEIVQFECAWFKRPFDLSFSPVRINDPRVLESLIGKRTRVTVEVLDD